MLFCLGLMTLCVISCSDQQSSTGDEAAPEDEEIEELLANMDPDEESTDSDILNTEEDSNFRPKKRRKRKHRRSKSDIPSEESGIASLSTPPKERKRSFPKILCFQTGNRFGSSEKKGRVCLWRNISARLAQIKKPGC